MKIKLLKPLYALLTLVIFSNCKSKVKVNDDEIYSRHLQRHVKLTIISTPLPNDKSDMNLLLLNDGQDMNQLGVKEVIDSLNRQKLLKPLLVVGIHAGDRMQEYGVAGVPDYKGRGGKADKYDDFFNNELYPFVKKQVGIRKFKSVVIAGSSIGGLSALDIAWNHPDKISKVGVFSGALWWRDKDDKAADYDNDKNRIILAKIKKSRKKAALQFWFYTGNKEEAADRDNDGINDVMDDTRDMVKMLKEKDQYLPEDILVIEDANGTHDQRSWRKHFPAFLLWAFGK